MQCHRHLEPRILQALCGLSQRKLLFFIFPAIRNTDCNSTFCGVPVISVSQEANVYHLRLLQKLKFVLHMS